VPDGLPRNGGPARFPRSLMMDFARLKYHALRALSEIRESVPEGAADGGGRGETAQAWLLALAALHCLSFRGVIEGGLTAGLAPVEQEPTPAGEMTALASAPLLAACRALAPVIPGLFPPIVANGAHFPFEAARRPSALSALFDAFDAQEWRRVEILGWLYQYCASSGREGAQRGRIAHQHIAAETQVFTPRWIVRFLVENSVGVLLDEMGAAPQLVASMKERVHIERRAGRLERRTHGLEALSVLDPACGCGQMLLQAYEGLHAAHVEQGRDAASAAQLVLQRNLFGLDLDPRAAAIARDLLLMRGGQDDPRLLRGGVMLLNIASAAPIPGVVSGEAGQALEGAEQEPALDLLQAFAAGACAGSLVRIPQAAADRLPECAALAGRLLQATSAAT